MNTGFVRAVLSALLAFCPCAVRAAAFEAGPPPSGAVCDPGEVLHEDARAEISLSLERMGKGVEVIAVVLTNLESVPPEDAVAKMAAAWCVAPLHAVVLHVPGREDSPWIVAGGELIHALNPDEVRDELAAVRRDASREPDDASKVRTAAIATADLLRFWKGREITRLGVIDSMRASIRRELETRARRQQAMMLAVAIASMAGAITAVRLLGKFRRISANKP